MKRCAVFSLVLAFSASAQAGLTGMSLGTGSPPTTLGPYTMTPFSADPQSYVTYVTSVASPLGGSVGLSPSLLHYAIGHGWTDWGQGYTGDIYYTGSYNVHSITLTLPADTGAFYLYAQPAMCFTVFNITALASDGSTQVAVTNNFLASGGIPVAQGYAFWDTTGISSITLTIDSNYAWSIGEFGIAKLSSTPPTPSVPVPGALLLGALGAGAIGWLRMRRAFA